MKKKSARISKSKKDNSFRSFFQSKNVKILLVLIGLVLIVSVGYSQMTGTNIFSRIFSDEVDFELFAPGGSVEFTDIIIYAKQNTRTNPAMEDVLEVKDGGYLVGRISNDDGVVSNILILITATGPNDFRNYVDGGTNVGKVSSLNLIVADLGPDRSLTSLDGCEVIENDDGTFSQTCHYNGGFSTEEGPNSIKFKVQDAKGVNLEETISFEVISPETYQQKLANDEIGYSELVPDIDYLKIGNTMVGSACGNGVINNKPFIKQGYMEVGEGYELCDGAELDDVTCLTLIEYTDDGNLKSYGDGDLHCSNDCRSYDPGECVEYCDTRGYNIWNPPSYDFVDNCVDIPDDGAIEVKLNFMRPIHTDRARWKLFENVPDRIELYIHDVQYDELMLKLQSKNPAAESSTATGSTDARKELADYMIVKVYDLDDDDSEGIDNVCFDAGITVAHFYMDADEDGYGDPYASTACENLLKDGYVKNSLDCDDTDATITNQCHAIGAENIQDPPQCTDYYSLDEYGGECIYTSVCDREISESVKISIGLYDTEEDCEVALNLLGEPETPPPPKPNDVINLDTADTRTDATDVDEITELIIYGETHEIEVKQAADGTVTLEIRSEPQTIVLAINESVEIDIDGDGINDFTVTYKGMLKERPVFVYAVIPEIIVEPEDINGTIESEINETDNETNGTIDLDNNETDTDPDPDPDTSTPSYSGSSGSSSSRGGIPTQTGTSNNGTGSNDDDGSSEPEAPEEEPEQPEEPTDDPEESEEPEDERGIWQKIVDFFQGLFD